VLVFAVWHDGIGRARRRLILAGAHANAPQLIYDIRPAADVARWPGEGSIQNARASAVTLIRKLNRRYAHLYFGDM